MTIVLTGGTGYIGSRVLSKLIAAGHDVVAVVRSEDSKAAVEKAGATAALGDIGDRAWLATLLASSDGAIHTAALDAAGDAVVIGAVADAFADSGKPYVHTSGIWTYGDSAEITEDAPFDPPALTSWRLGTEAALLETPGARISIVSPAVVYGDGGGIPASLAQAPQDPDGALHLVGDGSQHWTTVHVDDIAALYLLALSSGVGGEYYIGASGENPTVAELAAAAARGAGLSGAVVAETREQSEERFGEAFAGALFLDQQATGAKARAELGWNPTGPSLLSELESGSYATTPPVE